MSRTSDVIGSGYNQSLDESMKLVVRKITERCGSTQASGLLVLHHLTFLALPNFSFAGL